MLAGKRYYKTLMILLGFLPAYVLAHCLIGVFGFTAEWQAIVFGIVIGVCNLLLSWLFMFSVGFWVVALPLCAVGLIVIPIIPAIAGIIGGIIVLIFRKHIIIPAMAFTGVSFFLSGLTMLLVIVPGFCTSVSPGAYCCTLLVAFVVLLVGSIFVQYKFTAKGLKTDEKKPEPAK